jgi:group I intron endonuclease
MYIYKITNLVNDKVYVGLTTRTIHQRYNDHLRAYKKEDTLLYRAMRKYGIENFEVTELEKTDDIEKLTALEYSWMKRLSSLSTTGKGYNIIASNSSNLKYTNGVGKRKGVSSKFTGVSYMKDKNYWKYSIQLPNSKFKRMECFSSEEDAAIMRDYELMKYFQIDDVINMLNFPENITDYLQNTIPKRTQVRLKSDKKSKFKNVIKLSNTKNWACRVLDQNSQPILKTLKTELDSAIMADIYMVKFGYSRELLNFPNNFQKYKNNEIDEPLSVQEHFKNSNPEKRKNICYISNPKGRLPYYYVVIRRNGKKYCDTSKDLNGAIYTRNNIFKELGESPPD